jgi:CHASE2 domain-containing sensor protein
MSHHDEHEPQPPKGGPRKPFHKHLGRRAKTAHKVVTKYLYERDTIFATLWVFVFIIVLGLIPLNLGVMNPIKLGLKDFDFNDLYFSKTSKGAKGLVLPDERITIINIGNADRGELALMIDYVAAKNPKVMALDALFYVEKDPQQDSLLRESFRKHKNLIAAHEYECKDKGKSCDTLGFIGNYFNTAATYAHVNLNNDELKTQRYFEAFVEDKAHNRYTSFPAAIVKAYNPEAYKKLEKKGTKKFIINYQRRVDRYWVYRYDSLLLGEVPDSRLKDKIVLFGYINNDKTDISDKKFTPMNDKIAGKSIPDMNGIIVHANVISQALDGSYFKKVPLWANLLLAIIVCWLHMSFFIHYYLESHIWFHLAAKIAQVLSAIFFVWLGMYIFERLHLKVDMKASLVVIVMAVDVIYFYEAWAVWMHKKYNYRTVFKPHHH